MHDMVNGVEVKEHWVAERREGGRDWSAVVTADFDDENAKYAHFGEAEGNRRGDGAV